MTLKDLPWDKATLSGLDDIVTQLQSRRYKSWFSLAIAVISAAWPVLALLAKAHALGAPLEALTPEHILRLGHSFLLKPGPTLYDQLTRHFWFWASWFVGIVFFTLFIVFKYTGFLFDQSKQPFRYTVYIQNFAQLAADTDCQLTAGAKQIELLPSDLMERIQLRLRRFSLLPPAKEAGDQQRTLASHFQIEADYAVRKDKSNALTIHVWPRVRVGAASNPFTVAYAVRLPLPKNATGLSPELYQRLVERVYSSVTTEIYKQIEVDLRGKMQRFPTDSFRALARYVEGRDFERSNTIEAFDKAIALYRTSLAELKSSWRHQASLFLARNISPLGRLRWTGIPGAMLAQARTNLGLARCLVYRRLASEMAGRRNYPIFEVRKLLFGKPGDKPEKSALELLSACYNARVPKEYRVSRDLLTYVRMADPLEESNEKFDGYLSDFCRALSRESRPGLAAIFREISEDEELCESAAISALAQSMLADSASANRFLRFAEAVELRSDSSETSPLILLVKSELQPEIPAAIRLLHEAAKQDPFSETILFRLARNCDLLARDDEAVTSQNIDYLARYYEAVLRINPGNIAARISLGYLYWLNRDLERAAENFEAGIDMETVVTRTYVGDLKFCLARVEAERGIAKRKAALKHEKEKAAMKDRPLDDTEDKDKDLALSSAHFQEAIQADPSVSSLNPSRLVSNLYFDRMGEDMCARFREYFEKVWRLPDQPEFRVIRSAALNDYANACLSYYLRFDTETAREEQLLRSLTLYRQAVNVRKEDQILQYNLVAACSWGFAMVNTPPPPWVQGDWSSFLDELTHKNDCLAPDARAYLAATTLQSLKDRESGLKADIEAKDREIAELEASAKPPKPEPQQEPESQRVSPLHVREPEPPSHTEDNPPRRIQPAKDHSGGFIVGVNENAASQLSLRLGAGSPPLIRERETQHDSRPKNANQPVLDNPVELRLDPLRSKRESLQKELKEVEAKLSEFTTSDQIIKKLTAQPRLRLFEQTMNKDAILPAGTDWDSFDEADVLSLAAYASYLCDLDKAGGFDLCEQIFDNFYPNYFDLLQRQVKSRSGRQKTSAARKKKALLENYSLGDPKNFHFKSLIRYPLEEAKPDPSLVATPDPAVRKQNEEDYKKLLDEARPYCESLPLYQNLAGNYEEAARLAPWNKDFRRKLRDNLRPDVCKLLGLKSEDQISSRDQPQTVEFHIDPTSARQFDFEFHFDVGSIEALRKTLRAHSGFVLPSVRFRDNASLNIGEFLILLDGYPIARNSSTSAASDQPAFWRDIVSSLESAVRLNAASLHGLVPCSAALETAGSTVCFEPIEILSKPDALSSFSLVLKTLLAEQLPIVPLSRLACEFNSCFRSGSSIAQIVSALRALPEIRAQLPGKLSPSDSGKLPDDLTQSLLDLVDLHGPDAPPNDWLPLRNQVRDFALAVILQNKNAVITDPPIRSLVAKACAGVGLHVLSSDEIDEIESPPPQRINNDKPSASASPA